ncbi:hypothetical protein BN903_20 [Halorubrum sp. AJ67]|nr:hypothetical protein BN903_20 [Halorubrum sp. AJ67]
MNVREERRPRDGHTHRRRDEADRNPRWRAPPSALLWARGAPGEEVSRRSNAEATDEAGEA